MSQKIISVGIKNKAYPEQLAQIPQPPKSLNVWGTFPHGEHFLAIVGTRRCTAYGREIVEKIVSGLVGHNFIIVSGLARGIDTAAHEAALRYHIPTIAVVGSGLSPAVLFPPQNRSLAEEIVAHDGAVVSEYDHDFLATVWSFPQRNRIISGLSQVTLVVEAPEKSGALNTAKFALDQNREVAAIPGSIFSANSKGANNLLKQGAHVIESAEDILQLYDLTYNAETKSAPDITAPEETILSIIAEPMDINTIIRKSSFSPSETQSIVGLMEIRGIIKRIGTEYFKI